MRINWIFATDVLFSPAVDLASLKKFGSFWGSWQTWRLCQTDNVICHDHDKAIELVEKKFHLVCNFHAPESCKKHLEGEGPIVYYNGEFNYETANQEEIVAMHLAAVNSDIILLYGFDWSPKDKLADPKAEYRVACSRNYIREIIRLNSTVQWVLISDSNSLFDEISDLDNLSVDTFPNVQQLLLSLDA